MARTSEVGAGITLDTGALIALERKKQRITALMRVALADDLRITVPAPVIAEWWRGRTDVRDDIIESVDVEPLSEEIAKRAGEALAAVPDATVVDAIVMASAAQRGDTVYTSDFDDLARLQTYFPGVRVLRI